MKIKRRVGRPLGSGMLKTQSVPGNFFRTFRLERGFSQKYLSKMTGLTQASISCIELGHRKYLKSSSLKRLAKVPGLDLNEVENMLSSEKNSEPTMTLGKIIRSRRIKSGLTIEDFSEKLGADYKSTRRLEFRQNHGTTYVAMRPVVNVLNLKPEVFSSFLGINGKQPTTDFGRKVRNRRKELLISLAELAKKLAVSKQFMSQIELGKVSLCQNHLMIKRLEEILGFSPASLMSVRSRGKIEMRRHLQLN